MSVDNSLWTYISDAGLVVKFVMLILLLASIASWALIFQRGCALKRARKALKDFEERFWSGAELTRLYVDFHDRRQRPTGLANIFCAGFKEFQRLQQQPGLSNEIVIEGVQRAMRVTSAREIDELDHRLVFLATVGSTSPYIGLFGTVWGIMTSFHALGSVQQATIPMVAPGISEALIATAMGLFAAIPAVISYNRYNNAVVRLGNEYETFQEEFSSILHRQLLSQSTPVATKV